MARETEIWDDARQEEASELARVMEGLKKMRKGRQQENEDRYKKVKEKANKGQLKVAPKSFKKKKMKELRTAGLNGIISVAE